METLLHILKEIKNNLEYMVLNGTDYAPEVRIYAIPLVIAVLTIMFPLLFAIVVRLDEKYSTREFGKLFLTTKPLWVFYISTGLCLLFVLLYAILRTSSHAAELSLRVLLCISATMSLLGVFSCLIKALEFSNPNRLLDYIVDKYNQQINAQRYENLLQNAKDEDQRKTIFDHFGEQYYSLFKHLTCYAITKQPALLYDIRQYFVSYLSLWKSYFIDTPLESHEIPYPMGLYTTLEYIVSAYKKNADDAEINTILANSLSNLFDETGQLASPQETYNLLFHIGITAASNGHEGLINEFQRWLRYIYLQKINNNTADRNSLRNFAIILNATLYCTNHKECADNAIANNFDAVIIGDQVILPLTARDCIWRYLKMINHFDRTWHSYINIMLGHDNNGDVTILHKYLTQYFAYLLVRQYHLGEEQHGVIDCIFVIENINEHICNLQKEVEEVMKNPLKTALSISPTDFFRGILNHTYEETFDEILSLPLQNESCRQIFLQTVDVQRVVSRFKDVISSNDVYVNRDTFYEVPLWESGVIERATLLTKDNYRLRENSFESRITEHFSNAIAEVYSRFKREEEVVELKDLKQRMLYFICKYDYKFLTLGLGDNNIFGLKSRMVGLGFSKYFPYKSLIVIPFTSLPYVECNTDEISIDSLTEINTPKGSYVDKNWIYPQVEIKVNLHTKVFYNPMHTIHVLKIA